jgi:small basic protein
VSALVRLASGESNFNREALVVLGLGWCFMVFYLVIPDSFSPWISCFLVTCIFYVFSKIRDRIGGQALIKKHG